MLKGARKNTVTKPSIVVGWDIKYTSIMSSASQPSNLERRDGDGNDLRIAVRDADSGVLDAGLVGSCLGIAVKLGNLLVKLFVTLSKSKIMNLPRQSGHQSPS
jgi:hypothetical protein